MKLKSLLLTPWQIEYEMNCVRQKAAEGTAIGKSLDVPFSAPIVVCKFHLAIAAHGRPAIAEFQLF